jgi:thiamine-monophosphate kinase
MASPLAEHDLIRRYFAPLAGPEGLALADDAAQLPPQPGSDFVVNTDMIAEGVHFFAGDPPAAIAAKALRVNLSDLAAKGAEPFAYTVALGLSDRCDEAWVADFAAGLGDDQRRFGVHLIGGDTNRTGAGVVVSITAFGSLPEGTMVHRAGARPGDAILVSGTIGDAALGLIIRQGRELAVSPAEREFLLRRQQRPEPRTALAPIVRRYATAAIDISDGLVGDLAKLCAASGVGANLEAARVPLSPAAAAALAADSGLLEPIVTGGDDYELLCTVPPERVEEVLSEAAKTGSPMTRIGLAATGGPEPLVVDADGGRLTFSRLAYDHFAGQGRL